MGRFDWADKGIFDVSALTEEEFTAHFKSMRPEDKKAILDDLDDETASAEDKAKAVAFVDRVGRLAMTAIDFLL